MPPRIAFPRYPSRAALSASTECQSYIEPSHFLSFYLNLKLTTVISGRLSQMIAHFEEALVKRTTRLPLVKYYITEHNIVDFLQHDTRRVVRRSYGIFCINIAVGGYRKRHQL